MSRYLVIYASTHGQTAKIADRIAAGLRETGGSVDLHAVGATDPEHLDGFDAVVVGASVHAGHHQREIIDWIRRHVDALDGMPSALFSVSLSAADDTEEARANVGKYIDDLLDHTAWSPWLMTSFAGALQYLEYDFLTRLVMRLLMAHGHKPTDTTRDYDYTDWDAVDAFAAQVAELAVQPQT